MARRQVDLLCILALFAIGQLVTGLLFSLPFGPIESPDTGSYLSAAENLRSLSGSYFGYIGFIVLLKVGLTLGSGIVFAIAINSIGVIVASWALLSLGRRYSGEIAGWLAASFYLLHPLINQWTRYVLTETLFYAGVALTAYFLMRSIDSNRWSWAPLWLVAGFTATLRPNGIVLLGAVVTVLALSRQPRLIRHALIVLATWMTVLVLAVVSPTLTATHGNFGPEVWSGTVVHGAPETSIAMPEPTGLDSSNAALIGYALNHPVDVLRLGATRVWWEMKQVRPWYSNELNFFLTVSMTALHSLALVGAWSMRRSQLNLIVISISVPFGMVIASTWAIWEGRFGWWFLVLWTVWAGIGANRLIGPLIKRLPATHPLRRLDARHETKIRPTGHRPDG